MNPTTITYGDDEWTLQLTPDEKVRCSDDDSAWIVSPREVNQRSGTYGAWLPTEVIQVALEMLEKSAKEKRRLEIARASSPTLAWREDKIGKWTSDLAPFIKVFATDTSLRVVIGHADSDQVTLWSSALTAAARAYSLHQQARGWLAAKPNHEGMKAVLAAFSWSAPKTNGQQFYCHVCENTHGALACIPAKLKPLMGKGPNE